MMPIRSSLTLAFVSSIFGLAGAAEWQGISSPNGAYEVGFSLSDKGRPLYRVTLNNTEIIAPSGLGFILARDVDWTTQFGNPLVSNRSRQNKNWKPVWGERAIVQDNFISATVTYPSEIPTGPLALEVRAYDQGIAFRYVIAKQGDVSEIRIDAEATEFCFEKDHDVWAVTSAQGKYSKKKLSELRNPVERRCLLETGGGKVIAIAEAALVDFARMRLRPSPSKPHTLVSKLHGPVVSKLPFKTPWRVIMAGDRAGDLLENNDLFLNLNEPNKIADTSWIMPGKVIRDVTLSTDGGLACVDFCVKYGMQFIEFDAGWYGDQNKEESDASTVARNTLDLPRVIKYAKEKGIGVILYVNRRHLEADLDNLLPIYQNWGIAGLKFGFVQHGDQKWTTWMHEAIVKCAKYKIMVDVHDEYRMTGWQRTYPNFMTAEGIGGDETRPPNRQALANLFSRGLCGPSDHTFCYYAGYVDETTSHAAQLAKMICFFSPWQFLFWYDQPATAKDEPELALIKDLPTTWDDTKVLHGEIGEYAAVARRSGDDWFVGCFNAGEPRALDLALDFLPDGTKFEATLYFDSSEVPTRTKVGIKKMPVDSTTVLKAAMSGQGGVAIRIAAKKSAGGAGILKRIDRAEPFFESWDEGNFHGPMAVAMDGTVLIFSVHGNKDGDKIYVNRSEDGGTTWSDHQFIGNHVELDWKALNIGPYDGKGWGRDKKFAYASLGTSVVDENTGEIMFFMTALHPAPYMYKSQDHGKTWKLEKIELKKDIKGYLTNPNPACDPGITIKHGPHKGRLLAPARVMVDYNKHAEAKGYTNAVYSDDHGKTWFSSEPFPLDGTGESGLVELSDGTIYFNSRTHTRKGNRWIAYSDDSGETWRDCHQDDELFDGPPDMYGCKAALLRLDRDDGDLLLFSSPDPSLPEKQNRANLNVWASFDGGKTWPVNRLIKEGPGNYSWMTQGRKGTPSEGIHFRPKHRRRDGTVQHGMAAAT